MQKLDKKAVWLFFFGYLLRWLIPIVVVGAYISILTFSQNTMEVLEDNARLGFGLVNWLVLVPAFLVLCFVWARLSYHFYRYELTPAGFRKESGVIYKRYVTIPYDRIQNVDIYRGIVARILGLSDLHIQTAGASATMGRYGAMGIGAEGRLPGLSKGVAEELRDELIARTRPSGRQGV